MGGHLYKMTSMVNPISHGVFDRDNIMGGGVLKTHSLKLDLVVILDLDLGFVKISLSKQTGIKTAF